MGIVKPRFTSYTRRAGWRSFPIGEAINASVNQVPVGKRENQALIAVGLAPAPTPKPGYQQPDPYCPPKNRTSRTMASVSCLQYCQQVAANFLPAFRARFGVDGFQIGGVKLPVPSWMPSSKL